MRSVLWTALAFPLLGLAGCDHAQSEFAQSFVTNAPVTDHAYEMMCKAYRQSVPLRVFAESLEHNAYLSGAPQVQALASEGSPTMMFRGVLRIPSGSYDVQVFEGVEEGRMCISGLSIGGTPMLPSPAASPTNAPGGEPSVLSAR